MDKIECWYVGHCDEPSCDLGKLQFKCVCGSINNDCGDAWWGRDKIIDGKIIKTKCHDCNTEFGIYWDKEEFDYYLLKIYSLEDSILFGKHKDESIKDIIDDGYITYLIENQGIELDNEAYEYYQKKI